MLLWRQSWRCFDEDDFRTRMMSILESSGWIVPRRDAGYTGRSRLKTELPGDRKRGRKRKMFMDVRKDMQEETDDPLWWEQPREEEQVLCTHKLKLCVNVT